MSKDTTTAEEFQKFINDNELEVPLQKYIQSNVDRRVEKIISQKVDDLRILASREKTIADALETAELNPSFAKYVTGNSKGEIEESVNKLKEDFLGIHQEKIDSKLEEGLPPSVGSKGGGGTDLESYLDKRNKKADTIPAVGFPTNK